MPLSNLNTQQSLSATCDLGHNLTIASAGTGKTSTIVGRIAHLLNSKIQPENILLLTFTNKASIEMISRIAQYFGDSISKKIVSGTFHSVSYKLLKSLNLNIQLKNPRELKTLFKSIYEKRIFKSIKNNISHYDGGYLYDIYSLYLNSTYNEQFSTWITNRNKEQKPFVLIYEDVINEFKILKKQYGYVNFDDLLLLMIEKLKINKFSFNEILVDEYQDTNPLQSQLLDAFECKSMFCVGDYDQSIYAFNGSDIEIISSFETKYDKAKIFTLDKNYRSTEDILSLATKVINHNPRIYKKNLTVVRKDSNIKPKLLVFGELYNQYEYVAQNILKSDVNHQDIAIIYRNNSSADGIEANLRDLNVKSIRKGGISFFDSREIKIVLDIMIIIISRNDMMAFIHIAEYGHQIGKAIAKDLFDALIKLGDGNVIDGLLHPKKNITNPYKKNAIKNVQLGLFDDFIELGSIGRFKKLNFNEAFFSNPILKHPKLTLEAASFLYSLYQLINELKKIKNPLNMIHHITEHSFFQSISDIITNTRAKQKDGSINKEIKENGYFKIKRKIEILKHLSANYTNIQKFLNAMILGSGELSGGKGVNLLSIHASKGLEFKEVYIVDLMEGRFPNRKLMQRGGSLEEERRLFYVAVTRAKDKLYLCYAKYDKIRKTDFVHSIFLQEAGFINK